MSYRIDFDISAVNESNKFDFINILESQRGTKYLYYDPGIVGFFDDPFIAEGINGNAKVLTDNFVVYCNELLPDHVLPSHIDVDIQSVDCIIYIVRPSFLSIKSVARHVQYYNNHKFRGQSHIYYVPHRTNVCDQILHDLGVFDLVEIHELDLGFVAYDMDVLSLQLPDYYKDMSTDEDYSSLNYVACG